jgi:ferritin heavy chain
MAYTASQAPVAPPMPTFVSTKHNLDHIPPQAYLAAVDAHKGSAASTGTTCRQNFSKGGEDALNAHIVKELYASMSYLAIQAYFDRADVALPGFAKWAHENSDEEKEHAEKFIKFMNQRGGKYIPQSIPKPEVTEFHSALEAMEYARKLEVAVNDSLLDLHKTAEGDPQFQDFIESEYLTEQVEAINQISGYIRKLMRVGPGLGEHTVDTELQ